MDGNTTNFSTNASQRYTLFPEVRISLIIILGVFDIISVVANSMVVLTVYGNRRLRSNTNVFITNLCIVDLICGLVLMPLVIHSIVLQEELSGFMCDFLGFLGVAYTSASSLTIALIALDRYHSIVNCLYYENIVTRHRTILGIVCVWILTLISASCPIIGWGQYQYDRPQFKCSLRQPDKHGFLWFYICTSVVFPYAVIVFCYTRIHLVARRHAKNMIAIHIHDTGKRIKAVSTTKTKLVYLVVGLFTVCWIPIHIIKLLENVSVKIPDSVVTLGTMLLLMNCSCNPFLYALITSHFRVGLRRLCKRIRRRFGQPVASPSGDQSKSSWSVSKPISNLYRYFQENDAGNMLACVGKTTSEDFRKERQGELGQNMLNRQMDSTARQTLQIPQKGKKLNSYSEKKNTLELPFLNDPEQRTALVTRQSNQYLDVVISPPSPMSNGQLSVLIEETSEQCAISDKRKQNSPKFPFIKIQQPELLSDKETPDNNSLKVPEVEK